MTPEQVREAAARLADDAAARCRGLGEELAWEWLTGYHRRTHPMSVLQNPVIPIVVRWSASEASLRVENRRCEDTVRPDRREHVNHACAILGTLAWPMLERLRACPMSDAEARRVAEHIQRVADGVTRETDVLFSVSMETDEDRAREARQHLFSLARR